MMKSRLSITKEQDRLIAMHSKVQGYLRQFPNVEHVGVGIKETDGRHTEELCFRVYVDRKLDRAMLRPEDRLPDTIYGVPTDVLEKMQTELNGGPDSQKYASMRGGVQIRNEFHQGDNRIGAGTVGCLARTTTGSKLVALTARHVLTDGLSGTPLPAVTTVEVGHPRWIKCCCCCSYNEVGSVMKVSAITDLDCGIVELDGSASSDVASESTEHEVEGIGTIAGVAQAVCYEKVSKRGAATSLTEGVVVDVMFEGTKILINPCIGYANFSEPGDSGAVILNASNKVIGLLVGSSRTAANKGVAHHIKPVLTELDITINGEGAGTAGLVGVPTSSCSGGSTICRNPAAQYFKELDDGSLFVSLQPTFSTEGPSGPLHQRQAAMGLVIPALEPRVFSSSIGWVEQAKNDAIATKLTVTAVGDPALHAAIQLLSTFQLDLLKSHFPGATSGTIDYDKTRNAYEQFMNGELRERPTGVHPYAGSYLVTDGPREPNGSFEMMFSGFAWLCVENGIDATEWTEIYNTLVMCQELFMTVYRRRPQSAPPAGSLPIPSFTPGAAGNSLEVTSFLGRPVRPGETGFGTSGFRFDHFNLTSTTSAAQMALDLDSFTSPAQSNEARKVFLRAKYAAFSYAQTKVAMKENIQRMLYTT